MPIVQPGKAKKNLDGDPDLSASVAVVPCLARGLVSSLPGSCCGNSRPQIQKWGGGNNVTLRTKIEGPSQPLPSCDQQGRVADVTACAQWGVGNETCQGLQRTPGCPRSGEGDACEKGYRNGPPT